MVSVLATSFTDWLAGVLFICMNVDYRLLWHLDDQAVKDGFVFYTTFYHAPPAIRVRPMFNASQRDPAINVIPSDYTGTAPCRDGRRRARLAGEAPQMG